MALQPNSSQYPQQISARSSKDAADGRLPDIHKIAVLRANALGDFIFALPALEALRHAYPQAEIVYLGQAWHASFLQNRPGPIDRAIALPYSKGVRDDGQTAYASPTELDCFFEEMAREQFDLAIQMHGGGRYSNPFLQRLRARVNVGLRAADAIALDRWLPYVYYQTEVIRYLEVVALVGAQPVDLRPSVAVTASDLDESFRAVPPSEKPLVLLHPGATDARRRWPPQKFAAVGDAVASRGMHVLVSGTEPERAVTDLIVETMSRDVQNLCGQISLHGLTGLLSRCALVISNDSGPMHLAMAVGTPTVGIYWVGNLINADPLWRAYHRPHVSYQIHCPVCGARCIDHDCGHRESIVAEVPVEDVVNSAWELLDSNG